MFRMTWRRVLAAVVVVGVVVVLGTTVAAINQPPSVSAQLNCGEDTDCPDIGRDPDPDVTSLVHVTHYEDTLYNPRRVEPNTGESWLITAKYASADSGVDCKCATEEYTATVDVDWSNLTEAFSISASTGTTTDPFNAARMCTDDTCTDSSGPSDVKRGYGYRLAIDLDHTVLIDCPIDGWREFYLDQVLYRTTSVDNGNLLTGDCTYVTPIPGVTPDSQTWQVGDNGAWSCTDTCPTGVSIEINY